MVPRQFAVVRLSDRCRSATVPLRNEGSLPVVVQISLETSPSSGDASALRLVSPKRTSILSGEQVGVLHCKLPMIADNLWIVCETASMY